MKIIKIADQRFRDGVKSRFCFSFSYFSESVLRMQHCFFSHFSIHFFFRWRYSPFRLRRCLRILIRSWMSCNITRRMAISRRSETMITGHSSHMDAPKEQTLVRATMSMLFAAFQNRFSRLSLDDKNIDCALLSIESSGPGAEFSTCRKSKPLLLPLDVSGMALVDDS